MKVGILIKGLPPWYVNGHIHETSRLIRILKERSCGVTIVCFSPQNIDSYEGCRVVSIRPHLRFLPHLGGLLGTLEIASKVAQVTKEESLSLILAHGADSAEGYAASIIGNLTHRPVIIRMHGIDVFKTARNLPFLLYPTLKLSSALVLLSDTALRLLMRVTSPSDRSKLIVIPGMVDTNRFHPKINGDGVRMKYGLGHSFVILTVGRLERRKGTSFLIQALPQVLEILPNTKLLVVGTGDELDELVSLVETLGLSRNVIFTGYIRDEMIPQFYAACDVFVLPAIADERGLTEGAPVVIAEASACGKPVIASNVGSTMDLVINGETGFLVAPGDPVELARLLIVLGSDSALQIRLGRTGRQFVVNKFAFDYVKVLWFELFKKLTMPEKQTLRQTPPKVP